MQTLILELVSSLLHDFIWCFRMITLEEEMNALCCTYILVLCLQDRDWEICDSIKGRIDQFKRTMPLIQDLKNPAMRDRHWTQIKNEVQKPFDQEGINPVFTGILDTKMLLLGLTTKYPFVDNKRISVCMKIIKPLNFV